MHKCVTCGGTFQPLLSDGMRYFHACPPLTKAELQALVTAGTIVLRGGETVDQAFARRVFDRPDKRDENVMPTDPSVTGSARVKAEGRGVLDVPDP